MRCFFMIFYVPQSNCVSPIFNETFMAHRATHADENRNILILHESDTTSS